MDEVAIQLDGLGKRYRIGRRRDPYGRLTESIAGAASASLAWARTRTREKPDWFWALQDVSAEIRRGEVVGIIGHNGAGKTTLLKVLSRITEPSAGTATLRGRVASLLEVGTGFHPELTGRENIFMSGAVLGMRRSELVRKFDEIVDFAGVEEFLDTPVKRYSSGMQVRLGFAVAAHLDSEILFIDEVLAVGDLSFQEKCLGKMSSVASDGRTVVFVSHNMGAIGTLCPVTLWLEKGKVRRIGESTSVVPDYVRSAGRDLGAAGTVAIDVDDRLEAQVLRVRTLDRRGAIAGSSECSDPLTIELLLDVRARLRGLYAYMEIWRPDGTVAMMSESRDVVPNPLDDLILGLHVITVTIPARSLAPGTYDVYLNLACRGARNQDVHSPGVVCAFRLSDTGTLRGDRRPGFFSTILDWGVRDASAATAGVVDVLGSPKGGR